MSRWRRLLLLSATVETALLLLAAVSHLDREAAAIGVLTGVATAFLFWRPNRVVVIIMGLLFANVAFWMVTATVSDFETREGLATIVLPLALAVSSVAGIISAAASVIPGRNAHQGPAPIGLAALSALVFVALAVLAFAEGGDPQSKHPGDIELRMHNTAFSIRDVHASGAQPHLYVVNDDLFWHTVTIDKLGIDLKVPVGSHRRLSISAPAGVHSFYCRIPGHAQAGMTGTITIS